jgi:hypothetical protein
VLGGRRTHYAEIYMGIPAQRASVIVDTGSHLTALPCSTYALDRTLRKRNADV